MQKSPLEVSVSGLFQVWDLCCRSSRLRELAPGDDPTKNDDAN
jgi:hypothetical protein